MTKKHPTGNDGLPEWRAISSSPASSSSSAPEPVPVRAQAPVIHAPTAKTLTAKTLTAEALTAKAAAATPDTGRPQTEAPSGSKQSTAKRPPRLAIVASASTLILALSVGAIYSFGQQQSDSGGIQTSTNDDGDLLVTDTLVAPTNDPLPFSDGVNLDATGGGTSRDESSDVAGPTNSDESSYRTAVFSQGMIYLRGRVPSQEIADAIVERASAVLGPDRVINEYVIDPSVPFDSSAGSPLYVEDLVLFGTASAKLEPAFKPLLDLGIVLMLQNPAVTITVIGHTDAKGDANENLALSEARVQAVVDYWVMAGIDPTRVTAVGRGEEAPAADNTTSEGRRTNRRVEFIIAGLLD